MEEIRFDFNNIFSGLIGPVHGVTEEDLNAITDSALKGVRHIGRLLEDRNARIALNLEWTHLPFQGEDMIREISSLGEIIAAKFDNVIFLGIGGSYLGLKAAQDALCLPYYNEFPPARNRRPRVYFEGNNLDPVTLGVLLKNLNPKKTFIVVISKSGETTETKCAFAIVEAWLKKGAGPRYGRQVCVITDPVRGSLRAKAQTERRKDPLSFRSFPLHEGVGGRFSEFNAGLLHLAVTGISIEKVFAGARAMRRRCLVCDIRGNPALLYAALHTVLSRSKGKRLAILMPFSETLKSTGDWYVQLLAESLGKKYARKIETAADGSERWLPDHDTIVNAGRTPVACRGTNDLHSVQQNNIEGANDKVVTFIRVNKFRGDMKVSGKSDILSGRRFSELMNLAQEATEWALVQEQRPNCAIIMPEVSPYHWGALLYFFEMATAFEGELLNVNAYDQPGVEGYKNYMYVKLGKTGMPDAIAAAVREKPLVKDAGYIIE